MHNYVLITETLSLYMLHTFIGRLLALHIDRSVTYGWARPLHAAWWAWGVLQELSTAEGPAVDALRRSVTAWAAGIVLYLLWDRFWRQRGNDQPRENPIFKPGFNMAIEWFLEFVIFVNNILPIVMVALVPNGTLPELLSVFGKQRGLIAAPLALWYGPRILDALSEYTGRGPIIDMLILVAISRVYGSNIAPTEERVGLVLGVPFDSLWIRYMVMKSQGFITGNASQDLAAITAAEAAKAAAFSAMSVASAASDAGENLEATLGGDAKTVAPISLSSLSSISSDAPTSIAEMGGQDRSGLEAILA